MKLAPDVAALALSCGVHPLAIDEEYIGGLERLVALVRAAEREACAQVGMMKAINGIEVAAAIRARGSKP